MDLIFRYIHFEKTYTCKASEMSYPQGLALNVGAPPFTSMPIFGQPGTVNQRVGLRPTGMPDSAPVSGPTEYNKQVMITKASYTYPILNTTRFPDIHARRKDLKNLVPRRGDLMFQMKPRMSHEGYEERYLLTHLQINHILQYEREVSLKILESSIDLIWAMRSEHYGNDTIENIVTGFIPFRRRSGIARMRRIMSRDAKILLFLQWLRDAKILQKFNETSKRVLPPGSKFQERLYFWVDKELCKKRFFYIGVCNTTQKHIINSRHVYDLHGVDTTHEVKAFSFWGNFPMNTKLGSFWIQNGTGPCQLFLSKYEYTGKEIAERLNKKLLKYRARKKYNPLYTCLRGEYIAMLIDAREFRRSSMTDFDRYQLFPFGAAYDVNRIHHDIHEYVPLRKMFTKYF
jgi:hypothetical protein